MPFITEQTADGWRVYDPDNPAIDVTDRDRAKAIDKATEMLTHLTAPNKAASSKPKRARSSRKQAKTPLPRLEQFLPGLHGGNDGFAVIGNDGKVRYPLRFTVKPSNTWETLDWEKIEGEAGVSFNEAMRRKSVIAVRFYELRRGGFQGRGIPAEWIGRLKRIKKLLEKLHAELNPKTVYAPSSGNDLNAWLSVLLVNLFAERAYKVSHDEVNRERFDYRKGIPPMFDFASALKWLPKAIENLEPARSPNHRPRADDVRDLVERLSGIWHEAGGQGLGCAMPNNVNGRYTGALYRMMQELFQQMGLKPLTGRQIEHALDSTWH